MKRFFALIACALLFVCVVPVAAIALPDSDAGEHYRKAEQSDDVAAGSDGLVTQSDQAEKLLYTRTTTVASGTYVNYINMTQDQLDGKEITVRFKGSDPLMYPRQDGIGVNGTKAWLYWKRVEPDSVDDLDGTWKLAHFPASYVAAAWADNPTPLNDAKQDGQVVIQPGDYNLIRFTTAGDSCTVDRITLVGGDVQQHEGPSTTVSGKTASQIVHDMKIGWNLGNTLESRVGGTGRPPAQPDRADIEVELCWSNPKATRELIHFVKSQGFNAVRVPVSWFQHIYDDGRDSDDPTSVYHIDEAWMARVHEVVDYCYDEGLYVTINTHHERLWLETPQFGDAGEHREQLKTELAAIWMQIATEFADYDQRLVFEGMNEPRASSESADAIQISHDREWGDSTPEDIKTLNQLNQTFVDTVRSVPSPYRDTRLLLMNTIGGGTRLTHISQLRIPTSPADRTQPDPYVGVSMHPYEPYNFASSYGDSWSDQTWSVTNQVSLEQVIYRAYATFSSKGVPVVLDEFNSQDFGNTEARKEWAKAYVGLARSYGITCFLWDNGSMTANAAGNVPAYVDRNAIPLQWTNESQESVARTIIAAASDDTADVAWESAADTDVPDGSSPRGRVLNEQTETSTGNSICVATVRASEIEAGDIATEFTGAAPTLVMTNQNGNGWTTLAPSYVAWNEGATGGVAYYWPDQVMRTWLASTQNASSGVEHTRDTLRRIKLTSTGSSTTVSRFVLTGVDPLPDVSNGSYGEGVGVRLLYTRPITLSYVKDDAGKLVSTWNSVGINTENPDVPGKDMAVRFTGTTPYLVFVDMTDDHGWHGWSSVRPYATVAADDGTGQKVAFFSWQDITETWSVNRAKDGESWQFDSVSIAVDSGSCQVVELVVLGGEVRSRPQMRDADDILTGDEMQKALYAGYNLGGHMEANYVPKNADGTPAVTQDGGWGVGGDLDLEIHWSRDAYITREMIHAVADRGFKTIRLPVTWFQHLHDEHGALYGDYTIDRAWMARVHELVDWCLEEDLYVVVNMHHENWIDRADLDTAYDNTDLPVKFRTVWTQIANEFAGYDQRLIFESMNEPHAADCGTDREWNQPNAGDISTVNRLNADFVALMRSMPDHANRFLLVPPFAASSGDAAQSGFVMPDDPSDCIAVSIHNYTPHSYTHYFMDHPEADPEQHVLTDIYRENIDQAFERIRLNCTSKGWRVVLGEFGVPYSTDAHIPDQEYWMTRFITHAKEQGFPCLYWRMDHGDYDSPSRWTMLDDQNSTWTGKLVHLVGIWFGILDDDDVEWGIDAYASPDEHVDMSEGRELLAGPRLLDYSDNDEPSWRTGRIALAWDELQGHEVAVKFSGSRPRLSLLKEWGEMWWGIDPYVVDREAGIAYFSAETIKTAWEQAGYDLADLHYVCVRADSNLLPPDVQVEQVSLIHCHEWGPWQRVKQATCDTTGELVRTCALDATHQLSREDEQPLGHDWAEPSYAWSADNATVQASAICTRDVSHTRSEEVDTTYAVVERPTASTTGTATYTARFSGKPFTTQVRTITLAALTSEPGSDVGGEVIVPPDPEQPGQEDEPEGDEPGESTGGEGGSSENRSQGGSDNGAGSNGSSVPTDIAVELLNNGEVIAQAAVNSDGSYLVRGVAPGTYNVVAVRSSDTRQVTGNADDIQSSASQSNPLDSEILAETTITITADDSKASVKADLEVGEKETASAHAAEMSVSLPLWAPLVLGGAVGAVVLVGVGIGFLRRR